jgi:hypothetical protein
MKTIIKSFLLTSILAFAIAGCQKMSDEEINVSLKSSVVPISVSSWTSGNAASECILASTYTGATSCGYSYKIDPWLAGTYAGGINITINANGSFNWTSSYPVCTVIVKAGRGAYIYYYTTPVYSDNNLVGWNGKGISHVTFCYSQPSLVIAVKSKFWFSDGSFGYVVSPGNLVANTSWCGDWGLGYMNYTVPSSFNLNRGDELIGRVEIYSNGDVEVFVNAGYTLDETCLYVGTLKALQEENLDVDGCPKYWTAPWRIILTDGTSHFFDL